MNYTPQKETIESIIEKATMALAYFLYQGIQQTLEPIRMARVGYGLLASGCSVRSDFLGTKLASHLIKSQQSDGGWADVEETLWCLGYLGAFGEKHISEITKGQEWLTSVKLPCGAWGKSKRDQPRIPITALASVFVPDVLSDDSLLWLKTQWEEDMKSPIQLSYKGAFFLISQKHSRASSHSTLIDRTIDYLVSEQSDDGGYGPWKDHPIGSDPWSTGIVLWGLSTLGKQAPKGTIERAVSWLESTQLSNGLWPYHYIDDGSAMALMGISKSLSILMER